MILCRTARYHCSISCGTGPRAEQDKSPVPKMNMADPPCPIIGNKISFGSVKATF